MLSSVGIILYTTDTPPKEPIKCLKIRAMEVIYKVTKSYKTSELQKHRRINKETHNRNTKKKNLLYLSNVISTAYIIWRRMEGSSRKPNLYVCGGGDHFMPQAQYNFIGITEENGNSNIQ